MSASRVGLDPEFAKKLALFERKLAANGIKVILTQALGPSRAEPLYTPQGRSRGKKVTNARGGYCWHNFGLAGDYAFVISGKVTWNGPWPYSER